MTGRKLAIGELIEGGLSALLARPVLVGLFILADAAMAYGFLWAEARYGLGLAAVIGLGVAGYTLLSSLLILALGERLAEVAADPAELFVRLVFAMAASLVVTVGSGLGALVFIVPGLYLLARWTIVAPLILLQGAGIRAALARSWELTDSSAWAFVVVTVMIYVPQGLLGFFGTTAIGDRLLQPSPGLALELIISSCFASFELAVVVFAYRELSPPPDQLSDVFA